MTISLVLDRRAFLATAGMAAGAVAVAGRISWSADPASDAAMDWAADHVFGTYPPYAHPIPFGYQSAPPVSFEVGSFDPHLMI